MRPARQHSIDQQKDPNIMTTPPPPYDGSNSGQPSWAKPAKKSKKPWIFGGIAAVVALFVVVGIAGGGEEKDKTSTATSSTISTVTVAPSTVTVAPTTTAAPAQVSTPVVVPVAPTTTAAAPAGGTMPAVVCMNLQAAQNLIQENGVFFSRSKDASGEDRMQLNDSNWVVVSQTPEAGASITEGDAVLSVVKIGEPSGC